METERFEALVDAILAIIITIMVLGLKVPEGNGFADIFAVFPQLGIYAVSFAYVGAYWSNHHHTVHTLTMVNGLILWANLLFLFCISLLPFVTDWFGRNLFDPVPTLVYGLVLFLTAMSFFLLRLAIARQDKCSHILQTVMAEDRRGLITGIVYVVALALAMFYPRVSVTLYTLLLLLWFMPEKKIEQAINDSSGNKDERKCEKNDELNRQSDI